MLSVLRRLPFTHPLEMSCDDPLCALHFAGLYPVAYLPSSSLSLFLGRPAPDLTSVLWYRPFKSLA